MLASRNDVGSGLVDADCDSFDSRDELGGYVIRQSPELDPNLRPADNVLDRSKDRGADAEFQETLLSQGKAGPGWTRPPRSRLQKNHAVEHDPRPLSRHLLFPARSFVFGERVLPGRFEHLIQL